MTTFKGYRTYAGCTAIFILGGLFAIGVIDRDAFEALTVIVGSLTGAALRSAVD